MTAQEKTDPRPDRAVMLAHLEHLFGGYLDGAEDGLIEIAWTTHVPDAAGKYGIKFAQLFGTDQLEEAADRAAEVNATPMCNVYVGGALRKPGTAPFARTIDDDFYAASALWCDLDSDDAVAQALVNYADAKPTFLVMTGTIPHQRVQCWWRLAERIDDPDQLRSALGGVAARMSGDPVVTNPARVMRLAGGIAWPQKPGRVTEPTGVIPLKKPGLREYLPEHLARVFPPVTTVISLAAHRERKHGPDGGDGTIVRQQLLGVAAGKVVDGREAYMAKLILATLIEYVGTTGAEPSAAELFDAAWPVYQRNVDFGRPGRGEDEFRQKCAYTARRFAEGKIRSLRTIDETIAVYAGRKAAREAFPQAEAATATARAPDAGRFRFETIADLRTLPPTKWLVKDWIPEGSMGILYGKWGGGKSFIAFDLMLHAAYGMQDWHGAGLPGEACDILIIAREGHQGFVQRIDAFKAFHGLVDDTDRVHFMRASVSFMRDEDFRDLCAAVAQQRRYRMVLIDTVARVLPGVDMNAPETITLFMERCAIISEITGAATIGVHHQNKSGTMMGSIFFEANADFIFEVTRLGDDESPLTRGEILCTKMKDGEDRWKRSVGFERIALGLDSSSLVVGSIGAAVANDYVLPPKETCRRILNAINEAWLAGRPLSHMPQAKKSGKYAPRVLGHQFDLPAERVDQLILAWLDNDVLVFEEADRKLHHRGLRVIGTID